MKNLHRKISAMLLAGMVVVGGFAASGVSAYANSFSIRENADIQRIKFYCQSEENIFVNKSEKILEEHIKSLNLNRSQFYGNRRGFVIRRPAQILIHLQNAKRSGKEFIKLEYNNLYYLIKIDK